MTTFSLVVDPTTTKEQDGFTQTFKAAFAGPPYFESYGEEEVHAEVWHPHLRDGVIILAWHEGSVIGFGCAMPLVSSPDDVRGFLMDSFEAGELPNDFRFEKAWYMSELGVMSEHRGVGLGYELVRHRLDAITTRGGTHYVMRTAADGSNSRHLYEVIGAQQLAREQDLSGEAQVSINGSKSTSRIYLYGECADATTAITSRIASRAATA